MSDRRRTARTTPEIPLRCRLGFHRWSPWRRYAEGFGNVRYVGHSTTQQYADRIEIRESRACTACGWAQDREAA